MSEGRIAEWAGSGLEELRERWRRDDVYLYDSVASTMDAARELAEADAPDGTIVIAREQTSGRGRGGRSWYSPRDGGVYLSMVFRPGLLEAPGLVPLLAGLGIAAELDRSFEGLDPGIKWPNDLVVGDGKVGGILSEAVWEEGAPRHLIVGVGLNVRPLPEEAPTEVREGSTALETALGREVSLVDVADAVVSGLEEQLADPPPRSLGPSLLDLLDRYDWLRDRRVEVIPDGEEERIEGTCVGVAPDGALLFRPDRGALRRLHGATVEAVAG